MLVKGKDVLLENADEAVFHFTLKDGIKVQDIAKQLYENRVLMFDENKDFKDYGENLNVRLFKGHDTIIFTMRNYGIDNYFYENDVELKFDLNGRVTGRTTNFRTGFDDFNESYVMLNRPREVVDLVNILDANFGKNQEATLMFNQDGCEYKIPVDGLAVINDLAQRSVEKQLFNAQKITSNEELDLLMRYTYRYKEQGYEFPVINFTRCKFRNIDFDKSRIDFRGSEVNFVGCYIDDCKMTDKFKEKVGFSENSQVFSCDFGKMGLEGKDTTFFRCNFATDCDLSKLVFCEVGNCKGIENSGLVPICNLLKTGEFVADGIYSETRLGVPKNFKNELSLKKINKKGIPVLLDYDTELKDFYKANEKLFKNRVLSVIQKATQEDMKRMTGDDVYKTFRKALQEDLKLVSCITQVCGDVVKSKGKNVQETYYERSNIADKVSLEAIVDLKNENKIRSNGYGFYDIVEENIKETKPKRKSKVVKNNKEMEM